MGRLERRVASMIRINLLKDRHPIDRLRGWWSGVVERLTPATTDLADVVKLEAANEVLRREMTRLGSVIREMNQAFPGAAKRVEIGAVYDFKLDEDKVLLVHGQPVPPVTKPDPTKGFLPQDLSPLPNPYRERVLQDELDRTKRELAALDSKMSLASLTAQELLLLVKIGEMTKALATLERLLQHLRPLAVPPPKPLPGSRWPENTPSFDEATKEDGYPS